MPAWSLLTGGAAATEWFTKRFIRARALATAAGVSNDDNFDTIIAEDFAQTVTSELVDVVGVADANAVSFYNAGVVEVVAGDAAVAPSHARLQLTDAPSHVGDLAGKDWYAAALVRIVRPPDDELADTVADAIGLWNADGDRVGLGIFGAGSGGSTTNWVGYAIKDSSVETVLGPALGDGEGARWHLFEAWKLGDTLSFAFDGTTFADTIDAADVPALPATLSMISERLAIGNVVRPNYDKACVIVRSPRVGEAD